MTHEYDEDEMKTSMRVAWAIWIFAVVVLLLLSAWSMGVF